jgi:hypothetical protein
MANMPASPMSALMNWMTSHADLWDNAPTQIGLSAARVAGLQTLLGDAAKDIAGATEARLASKIATGKQNDSIRAARDEAAEMIQVIKGFIESSGNTNLWNVAGLTPNSPPGTVPPPTTPESIIAMLDVTGNLTLSWKATQPAPGTVYRIRRAFNGSPSYALLDTVGEKFFIDETIPLGTQQVSYQISARRGGQESPRSGTLTVQFGRVQGPGGGLTIVSETFNGKPVNFQDAQAA